MCVPLCKPCDPMVTGGFFMVTGQASLSMKFSRQEYWNGLPFPSPGIEPVSPALQADAISEPPGKPHQKLFWTMCRIVNDHQRHAE